MREREQPAGTLKLPRGLLLFLTLCAASAISAAFVSMALAMFTNDFNNGGNTFDTDTLNPPTSLSAAESGGSIDLTWTATVDTYATGYQVLRGTSSGGPYSQIDTVTPRTATAYTDSPGSGTFYYVLRSYYQSWESFPSNEASATIAGEPTTTSFVSVADTYVKEDKPTDNFGTQAFMQVKSSPLKVKRALVSFDVSSIPGGSTIDSATLTLCLTAIASGRVHEVRMVTGNWTETAVTWSSQPTVSGTVTDTITVPATVGCVTWTVTSDVQAWVDGTTNRGWRIGDQDETTNSVDSTYRTREDPTVAERPKLTVTYTP